jgi:hypothetical protein
MTNMKSAILVHLRLLYLIRYFASKLAVKTLCSSPLANDIFVNVFADQDEPS